MVPLQNYYYLSQYLEWFTIYITKSEVKSDEKGLSYSHDKICIQNLMKILFVDFKLFHFTNTHIPSFHLIERNILVITELLPFER